MIDIEKYKAVIFDMDGLLIDTERVGLDAYLKVCEDISVEPEMDMYHACIGVDRRAVRKLFKGAYGEDFLFEEYEQMWREEYMKIINQSSTILKDGILELLKNLKKHNLKLALATSSNQEFAMIKLKIAGLVEYFDEIILGFHQYILPYQ